MTRFSRADLGQVLNRVVIISALGYFVDIYDLILFSIVRIPSLNGIGITDPTQVRDIGAQLLSWQMGGMLLGGILWGILGDKRGRRSVLFGSIALYSVCNILNAFVTNVPQYAAARFFAGVGLAGELGAAVTLVSEALPTRLRGYGTSIVAAVGILGAAVGYFVAKVEYPFTGIDSWQVAYIVGGGMGLVLLVARVAISESKLFRQTEARQVARGSLLMLVGSAARAKKFAYSVLIGLPLWCVIGILITFSPEISRDLGVRGTVTGGEAILYTYLGISAGSLAAGILSQQLKSRKLVVIAFVTLTAVGNFLYFGLRGIPVGAFYSICALLGFASGYWAIFVQMAAEQFGTNLRATVATSVPNFIRGSVVPLAFVYTNALVKVFDQAESAMLLLTFCILVSLYCVRKLDETYAKDLDYLERPTASLKPGRAVPAPASK